MARTADRSKEPGKDRKDPWIVVAAYNEERNIRTLLQEAKKHGFPIVVVNDGSRDGTSAAARKAGVIVLDHIVNLGKGAAMKTGAEYAFGKGAPAIIFMDGDGQHHPHELPVFAKELRAHDIVFSYRRRQGPAPLIRRLGGRTVNALFRILYGIRLQDSICGYRAMTKRGYERVRWNSRDYSVESEMIARAGKARLSYTEIPIDTIYHDKYKGMTVLDGIIVLWNLFWWRFTL